jgi:hypothetical protein
MRRAGPALALLLALAALAAGAGTIGSARAATAPDETLTVSAKSPAPAVSRPLDGGRDYLVTVTGAIGVHAGVAAECDALYCFAGKVTGPIANLRVDREGQSLIQVGRCKQIGVAYSRKHRYSHTVSGVSGPLRFFFADSPDSFADNTGAFTITIKDLGESSGSCGIRWPALPDPLVPLATVANGCGPSDKATADPRYGDLGTYSATPLGSKEIRDYKVSFRPACDQHDAGYSHARVRDMRLNGGKTIDYLAWTKKGVDNKFLTDMLTLCDNAIPASAPSARTKCRNLGARPRYALVVAGAALVGAYQDGPTALTGSWSGQTGKEALAGDGWLIRQDGRNVTATWRYPGEKGKKGEFRGVIIGKDGFSTLTGFYALTDADGVATKPAPLSFTWRAPTPNRLFGTGGLTLSR